uniref:Thiamin biosynthesis protein S n=1 Tax=Centroceras clavulatum TaxID=159503 RepID=A0A4D6WRC9_9FLOR|nr:Thiamin biosynthesis protein S [Centroceras clavulatum]
MDNTYFKIIINGKPFNCSASMSIKDILIYLDIDLHKVVIEYNKIIVNHLQFNQILVQEGDNLEIITIVGGG